MRISDWSADVCSSDLEAGEAALTVVAADEILNTEDLIEMVNAGLLPATVADEGLADFVARIFDNIVVHKDLAVHGPHSIAWAFRKSTLLLAAAVNGCWSPASTDTRTGTTVLHQYTNSPP